MQTPFTVTGGARMGWTNASYPLARLSVTPDELRLSVRILGTYSFAPNEVSAIEKYVRIPFIAQGVRIRHIKIECPERVIFWCKSNPDTVLQGIRDSGFVPGASDSSTPVREGQALRWSAIVIAIAAWNATFLLAYHGPEGISPRPRPFILAPLLMAFALSIATLNSAGLQNIVLKPGRNVGEIKPFLRLLALVSGIMLVIFSIILMTGGFK